MPNVCTPEVQYSVQNVEFMKFGNDQFKETKDHSKVYLFYNTNKQWGLSQSKDYVCIGDINRMTSQRKRGGGTGCFNDASIKSQFYGVVDSYDHC